MYICDSDLDIGKAQFCYYFIKFSKNTQIKRSLAFIETKLSMLLNFETTGNQTSLQDKDSNVFVNIISKIPKEWMLKGKKLFDVIR